MKKVVSLLLVLVLALGMSTVAFAATKAASYSGDPITTEEWDDEASSTLTEGASWRFEITPDRFPAEEGKNYASDGILSRSEVDASKIKVSVKYEEGKTLVDTVEVKRKDGLMVVWAELKDPILVTKDDEITLDAVVSVKIGSKTKYELPLSGTYTPDTLELDADAEEDNISDGVLVMPDAYVANYTAYLDEDDTISASMKLFKGRNFYFIAEEDIADEDAETVDAYGFDTVFKLTYSANAASGTKGINFHDIGGDFYVYGSKSGAAIKGKADVAKDLVYLGKTGDSDLPLYSKYYLAVRQIDLDIDDVIDEPTDIDAPVLSDDGGGDGYIPNVNDNPGTGK